MKIKEKLTKFMVPVFGATLGVIAAYVLVGLVCFAFFVSGYYIVKKYNKPNTKLYKDIQPKQYIGFILMFIGLIPFLQYFMVSFMFSAGESLFNEMF